jgi:alkylation response protein AidB-like acyl-CoA dehydrogenase
MTTSIFDAELIARVDSLCREVRPDYVPPRQSWAAQFDHGLAWPSFPVGLGGLDTTPRQQWLVANALKDRRTPTNFPDNPVGLGIVAPVLASLGTDEQKSCHLRPLFIGDEIWCQLFSEPGAGSYLAGVATTAVRDGEGWLVNGQKVSTTHAHLAKWGSAVGAGGPERAEAPGYNLLHRGHSRTGTVGDQ